VGMEVREEGGDGEAARDEKGDDREIRELFSPPRCKSESWTTSRRVHSEMRRWMLGFRRRKRCTSIASFIWRSPSFCSPSSIAGAHIARRAETGDYATNALTTMTCPIPAVRGPLGPKLQDSAANKRRIRVSGGSCWEHERSRLRLCGGEEEQASSGTMMLSSLPINGCVLFFILDLRRAIELTFDTESRQRAINEVEHRVFDSDNTHYLFYLSRTQAVLTASVTTPTDLEPVVQHIGEMESQTHPEEARSHLCRHALQRQGPRDGHDVHAARVRAGLSPEKQDCGWRATVAMLEKYHPGAPRGCYRRRLARRARAE
jgi:hypothetical protein